MSTHTSSMEPASATSKPAGAPVTAPVNDKECATPPRPRENSNDRTFPLLPSLALLEKKGKVENTGRKLASTAPAPVVELIPPPVGLPCELEIKIKIKSNLPLASSSVETPSPRFFDSIRKKNVERLPIEYDLTIGYNIPHSLHIPDDAHLELRPIFQGPTASAIETPISAFLRLPVSWLPVKFRLQIVKPPPPMPPFLRLPVELHRMIGFHLLADPLDFYGLSSLGETCRQLYTVFAAPKVSMGLLLKMEMKLMSGSIHDRLACKLCLKLRKPRMFADTMTKNCKDKGGSKACQRFCLDCGFAPRMYKYKR